MENNDIKNRLQFQKAIITDDEQKSLQKFKELLTSKKLDYCPVKNDDSVLIRFLRARKMDLAKTFEMFSNTLKWRKEVNLDQIFEYEFNELPLVKKYYPHGFHKIDKLGRPIYFEISGDLDIEELLKVTSIDRMFRYQIRQYEYLMNFIFPACSQKVNSYVYQSLSIFDLKKHTTKFMSKKILDLVKIVSSFSQNHYPETLGALYIINSGMMFKVVWTAVKPFLDEKTKKKIVTLGSDYKKKLLEVIDEDNLPSILGGKCNCVGGCIYSGEGPWKGYVDEEIKKIENWNKIDLNFGFFKNKDEIDQIFKDNNAKENNSNNIDDNLENNFYNQNDLDVVDENMDKMLKNQDFENDEENKSNLEKLTLQLKSNINFENPNNKFINRNIHFLDGETPINTQEVYFINSFI